MSPLRPVSSAALQLTARLVALATLAACADPVDDPIDRQQWEAELYSPTLLTELEDRYFLVDCWHNRILYNDELGEDLLEWEVLDGELAGPHSIATDGELYVVDDTGHHRIRVYEETEAGFEVVQQFGDDELWYRPHRVHYDEQTDSFYVLGSRSQTISRFVPENGQLREEYTRELEFLDGAYTRSMSIIDGHMYFVSGPDRIHKTRHRDDSYDIVDSWAVPPVHGQMNDIYRVDDHWYLTATYNWWDDEFFEDNTIVRCEDLEDFADGECTDVKEQLGIHGAPYYLSSVDDRIWVPEVFQYSAVTSFVPGDDGEITDVDTRWDFGTPEARNEEQRHRLPK